MYVIHIASNYGDMRENQIGSFEHKIDAMHAMEEIYKHINISMLHMVEINGDKDVITCQLGYEDDEWVKYEIKEVADNLEKK